MDVSLTPSQSFRMTGITFAAAGAHPVLSTANGAIRVHSTGNAANNSARVDHCHFKPWYVFRALWFHGWTYGVVDHIVGVGLDGDLRVSCRRKTHSDYVNEPTDAVAAKQRRRSAADVDRFDRVAVA